jgi:hypothetical protein
MNTDHTELALDADGIPILTDLVPAKDMESTQAITAAELPVPPTPREITDELLASEAVQLQLDQIAKNLAEDVRLQIEQTLAGAIDEAINKTLDKSSVLSYEKIRRQLDITLAEFVAKALQDNSPVS